MQHVIKCESWEKPSKYETVRQTINWARVIKDCPDCDRKRIMACRDSACNLTRKH
jgi:hypothetical protein